MLAYDRATLITAILAVFFIAIALIAVTRTLLRSDKPTRWRMRFGIFLERDVPAGYEADDEDDAPS